MIVILSFKLVTWLNGSDVNLVHPKARLLEKNWKLNLIPCIKIFMASYLRWSA